MNRFQIRADRFVKPFHVIIARLYELRGEGTICRVFCVTYGKHDNKTHRGGAGVGDFSWH